jgi:hypothetical protein
MRTASDFSDAVAAFDSESVDVVILDLSTAVVDVSALVSAATVDSAKVRKIIAFGPHVHAERLSAAREAGCDEVVSRGQFFAQVDTILQRSAGA